MDKENKGEQPPPVRRLIAPHLPESVAHPSLGKSVAKRRSFLRRDAWLLCKVLGSRVPHVDVQVRNIEVTSPHHGFLRLPAAHSLQDMP